MKRKFSIAISLAAVLALTLTSLALAAHEAAAHVKFITDLPASCQNQANVFFISYIDPITHQPGSIPGGPTPFTLDTAPSSPVTFLYDLIVNCPDGNTYNLLPGPPGNEVTSGNPNSITTVTGRYTSGLDTTPPVLTLPSDITVTALNASGAPVEFTATANDDVDGPVPVTCSHVSGSTFPIGTTTVECSATDSSGNVANGSFTITVQYAAEGKKCKGVAGHQILQPINKDGSSVFKQGRVVPAKFRVCGANGVSIGTSGLVQSFRLIQIIDSDGAVSDVDMDVDSVNHHANFRFGNRQWIFNMDTKKLDAGNTYVYRIALNDGSTIEFRFTLK